MTLKVFFAIGERCIFRTPPKRLRKTFALAKICPVQSNCCRNYSTTNEDTFDTVQMQKYLAFISDQKSNTKILEGSHPNVLKTIIELVEKKKNIEADLITLEKMPSDNDKEFQKLMEAERKNFCDTITEIKNEILQNILLLQDEEDNRNVQIQVIPGVGGAEALLFGRELFSMYLNYIEYKKWECTEINEESGHILVKGDYVFKHLKHEAGVHRVQRVPETERQGRTHTSTCSIAVLPLPKPHEIVIKPNDIIVEKKTSSGPGGQNVNKNETCVRITHKATGITVESQSSRYQYDNKEIALEKLRCILFNMEEEKYQSDTKALRKKQVGNNEYSDKIRTYHFSQNRVTDHRINFTLPNVRGFLVGGKELEEMIAKVSQLGRNKELVEYLERVLQSNEFKHFEKRTQQVSLSK